MISRKQEWFANWEEGGRSYRLERRSNKAGNYLYCSVRDAGWKRFGICIPEGRGLVRGWKIMAEKLRSLGVGLKRLERQKTIVREEIMAHETSMMDTPKSFAEAVKGTGSGVTEEVIRVRVGKNETVERLGQLESCLVGWWGGGTSSIPDLKTLKYRTRQTWKVTGRMKVEVLGRGLWLFGFGSPNKARRTLREGTGSVGGLPISLREWGKDVGCKVGRERCSTVWVRLLGLPLHLWSQSILKRIGDKCCRFDAVDENTELLNDPRWARIRVKWGGSSSPGSMIVSEGDRNFEIQLWWELQPQMMWENRMSKPRRDTGTREEGDEYPRATERVGHAAQDRMKKQEKSNGISHRKSEKLLGVEINKDGVGSQDKQKVVLVEQTGRGASEQEDGCRCRQGPTGTGQAVRRDWGKKKGQGEFGGNGISHRKTEKLLGVERNKDGVGSRDEQKEELVEQNGRGASVQEVGCRCRPGPTGTGQVVRREGGKKKGQGEFEGAEPITNQAVGTGTNQLGPLKLMGPTENVSPAQERVRENPTEEQANEGQKNCSISPEGKQLKLKLIREAYPSHNWKEGDRREDQVGTSSLENDVFRYVRFNYEDSPSSMTSVFGWPLLMGGSSGQDMLKKIDDVEPLKMVTVDGREWSLDSSDALEVIKEGLCKEGQQLEEIVPVEVEELGYEKWEDSCLVKFSEFLGFSTVGFESEILGLLSKIVARQHQVENKGVNTNSRCERELKKLVCTINYDGRSQIKGGEKERGSSLSRS